MRIRRTARHVRRSPQARIVQIHPESLAAPLRQILAPHDGPFHGAAMPVHADRAAIAVPQGRLRVTEAREDDENENEHGQTPPMQNAEASAQHVSAMRCASAGQEYWPNRRHSGAHDRDTNRATISEGPALRA